MIRLRLKNHLSRLKYIIEMYCSVLENLLRPLTVVKNHQLELQKYISITNQKNWYINIICYTI